jgi:hypothetical protein
MFRTSHTVRRGGRSRRGARTATNEVEQSAKVFSAGGRFVVRRHCEDMIARGPLVVLGSFLVERLMEWETTGASGGERCRPDTILGTGAKGCGWGTDIVLIVAVIAYMIPAMRHGRNGARDLLRGTARGDWDRDGLGWSLDCQGGDRGVLRPAVSDFGGSHGFDSCGRERIEKWV